MMPVLFKWFMIAGLFTGHAAKGPVPAGSHKHPVYMSVTEIEHNAKERTLEISCKIFTNDFENTLKQNYKTYIDLIEPKDKAAMNKLVSDYVQKHLSIKLEGRPVQLQFLGYEQVEEGINSYYQVDNVGSVKKIEITDNILFDYKKEQVSLLHVIVNGNRKSTKLVNPDDKVSFEF